MSALATGGTSVLTLHSRPSKDEPREYVALVCTINVIAFIQSLYIENLLVFHCKLRMRDLNNTRQRANTRTNEQITNAAFTTFWI